MRKALITGGSGFIGTAISRLLFKRGFDVIKFDPNSRSNKSDQWTGSILNLNDLKSAIDGMDVVFHLAGLLGTTELMLKNGESINANITGTINVLEVCKLLGVGTIFYPTKPNDWLNTYSITKKAGEDFCKMYAKYKKMDVRILRWLNVYGPGQSLLPVRKAVPMMILQGLHNFDIEIYGSGEQFVYLIYVDDLARNTVLYTLAEDGDTIVRDTGNIVQLSVNELAEIIHRLTDSTAGIKHLPMRPGEDPTMIQLLPEQTAEEMFNLISETTPVENGINKTIEYYSKLPVTVKEEAIKFYYN